MIKQIKGKNDECYTKNYGVEPLLTLIMDSKNY